MAKITLEKLLDSLGSINANLNEGKELIGVISVKDSVKKNSARALNKMIEIVEGIK